MKNPLLRCIFLFAKWQNPVPCNSCSAEGITAQLKTDQVWTGAVLPSESVLHVQALWWVLTAQQLYSIFFCMNNRVILEVELTWLLSLQIKIWLLPSCMWAEKTFSCSWVNSKDQSFFSRWLYVLYAMGAWNGSKGRRNHQTKTLQGKN